MQKQLVTRIKELEKRPRQHYAPSDGGEHTSNVALQKLYPSIYFIASDRITYETSEGTQTYEGNITGSGFLLSDGTFVTARHMVEPWLFPSSPQDSILNLIANNMTKVVHHFTAYSPNGSKLTFSSENFKVDNSHDKAISLQVGGQPAVFTLPSLRDGYDWAACKVESAAGGGLAFDAQLSTQMPASSTLYILGYPFGMGVNSASDIKPIYSDCKVSRDGIDHGVIDISARAFDHGNSGGPVFAMNNSGNFVVVGIVSAGKETQGFIVPISSIQ